MRRLEISGRLHSPRSSTFVIQLAGVAAGLLPHMPPAGGAPHQRPNEPSETGTGNDLSHHDLSHHEQPLYDRSLYDLSLYDLGGRRLDRNLADALSLRRERSDHVAVAGMALAQLATACSITD
jgi:hypothetical protein